ncbi:uncharacterized protein LOC119990515 isoform X2 [Tripterygium wilfordii]|uniref:uncharacterized protein LOC119990515 isoform X2 n=1 Tax=Tripterygium wilfordii TaxID=458696 RepID=UPI0018F80C03|nr:uncharacterized protein LOC119990515 isoform X2 [Tripterygium wilfordii]
MHLLPQLAQFRADVFLALSDYLTLVCVRSPHNCQFDIKLSCHHSFLPSFLRLSSTYCSLRGFLASSKVCVFILLLSLGDARTACVTATVGETGGLGCSASGSILSVFITTKRSLCPSQPLDEALLNFSSSYWILSVVHHTSDFNSADSMLLDLPTEESRQPKSRLSVHPPPAFGSSPNLGALVLEANKSEEQDGDRLITYIWFLLVQRLMYQLLRLLLSAMDMESYTGGLLVSTSAQQPRWCHCPTISLFWMEKSDYNNSMEAYNIKQVIGVVYDVVLGFGSSFPSLYASSFKKREHMEDSEY